MSFLYLFFFNIFLQNINTRSPVPFKVIINNESNMVFKDLEFSTFKNEQKNIESAYPYLKSIKAKSNICQINKFELNNMNHYLIIRQNTFNKNIFIVEIVSSNLLLYKSYLKISKNEIFKYNTEKRSYGSLKYPEKIDYILTNQ